MTSSGWHVTVSVPRADGGNIGPANGKPAARALAKAARSDPALSGLTATGMMIPRLFGQDAQPDVLAVEMTVASGHPVMAFSKAWTAVGDALRQCGGWDLEQCSISMRPMAGAGEDDA